MSVVYELTTALIWAAKGGIQIVVDVIKIILVLATCFAVISVVMMLICLLLSFSSSVLVDASVLTILDEKPGIVGAIMIIGIILIWMWTK